jgi:hypothetical protein
MFRFAKRFAAAATAVMLAAFQAAPTPLPPALAALTGDAEAARSFDYMALKAEGADLKALSDTVSMRTRIDSDTQRCLTPAESILQTELAATALAADPASVAADRVAAEAAWARWLALGERVMSGTPVAEPPFDYVADQVAKAGEATDPRSRELLRRAARDQLIRRGWQVGAEVWETPPAPGARSRFESRLIAQMCETDMANTAWLKADVAANGWYRISVHGPAASSAAWVMAQHADRDRAFQRHVLTLLGPLVAAGETSAANLAYLHDRVAVGANRPQRYGTQGRCVAQGVWEPFELEDPGGVQARRDAAGIGSLTEYTAHMNRFCADAGG